MSDDRGHPLEASYIATIPIGAHLVTRRIGYTHHGIYVGAGRVVHYAGLARVGRRGPVEEVGLSEFACDREVSIKPEPAARFAGSNAAERARSRLGEGRYRLISNNCEHFCAWCLHGRSHSEQVEQLLALPRLVALLFLRLKRRVVARTRSARDSSGSRDLPQPACISSD